MPVGTERVCPPLAQGNEAWRTRVAAFWEVRSPAAGGYHNIVMQHMEMRWGRISRITTLEDTQYLARALERVAAGGNPEAAAAPITDDSATWTDAPDSLRNREP